MPTIDLGPPRPGPRDLLDGLPRRVTLTLPELRHVAEAAGDAPLPFDLVEHDASDDAGSPGGWAVRRRPRTPRRTTPPWPGSRHRPTPSPGGACSSTVRWTRGSSERSGCWRPRGSPSTSTWCAGGVQARCWHRQSGEAVASLSTADGLVFELAWFPTWAWVDELSRVAVIPEDLPLAESRVPGFVDLPHELADAGVEAVRSQRSDLLPVLAAQHRGRVTDETGDLLTDLEVGTVLTALAGEPQGRLRALVADVSGGRADHGRRRRVDAGRRRLACAAPAHGRRAAARRGPPGHPRGPRRATSRRSWPR